MIIKTKTIYENISELKAAISNGEIKIADEFITEDIDGEAKYVIAHVDDRYIYFVRKNLLKDTKPVRSKDFFNLFDWLNEEYLMSMPKKLRKEMICPEGQHMIDLPTEIQVFGKNEYGPKENREQWKYFKECKNRIALTNSKEECSHWWWIGTMVGSFAACFCACTSYGGANYYHASAANYYVRPRFILAKLKTDELPSPTTPEISLKSI